MKSRIQEICQEQEISESEYVRQALAARLRRDDRNRVAFTVKKAETA